MKKFDFSRYILVCRKQFVEDWRRQIGFTAVMAILLFFVFWIINWQIDMMTAMDETNSAMSEKSAITFSWTKIIAFASVVMLAIGYQSAHSMPFMKSKTSQIVHVVLPATTLEKYLATETFAFVFSVIEAIVAFFIADGLQFALTGRFTIADIASISFSELNNMFNIQEVNSFLSLVVCTVVASLFFHSAWFTLCATFFRKHPFLLGMLILWGINQVLSIFGSMVSLDFINEIFAAMDKMSKNEIMAQLQIFLYIAIFGQLVFAVGFWIWSYFRMKKVEL